MEKIILALLAILILLLLVVFASRRRMVKVYNKFLTVGNSRNITGLALAQYAQEKLNLPHLSVAYTKTHLGEAYSAKNKMIIMTPAVANYASLTSISTVAHELGHAVQDRQNNRLFGLVQILMRLTRFTNKFILPTLVSGLILFGLGYFQIISANLYSLGTTLTYLAFALILFQIIIKIITIPLEYDASKKALWFLKEYNLVTKSEMRRVKKLLSVAATTYIASLFDGFIVVGNKPRGLTNKNAPKTNNK